MPDGYQGADKGANGPRQWAMRATHSARARPRTRSAFPDMPTTGSGWNAASAPGLCRAPAALSPGRWQRMDAVPGHRLRYTRPPGFGRFTGGTVTCASTSLTSSSYHLASAACCARLTATRSRSSGDRPSRLRRAGQCWYLTVPLPPGPARAPCSRGYVQFRGSHGLCQIIPGNSVAATTPEWLWLTCLRPVLGPLGPTKAFYRLFEFFSNLLCELESTVTESNRRPSPYHGESTVSCSGLQGPCWLC